MNYFENPGPSTVPGFLKAKNPEKLRILMFKNNLKLRGFVTYRDIQWIDKEKMWYAWFDAPIDRVPLREGRDGDI
ncbi:MAG: hypothetical protein DRQ40_09585 [Gammaproteobacteria bacterium]|nr:MAG: hypothetical protein DRQ40_09585 [Gammaproteobacteria bacterium]